MKTTDEWMAETMQPILNRIGGPMTVDEERETRERIERMTGPSFRMAFQNVFHTCKVADNLPSGCTGCRETIDGRLVCCNEEINNEPR